jgi:SAM-dependent methyltransferase
MIRESQDYLNMQKSYYDVEASKWNLTDKNPVVGSYHQHNEWDDYNEFLFKDFDTSNLIALEYGCGPARNLIRFNDRFKRIDGTDISQINIDKAIINLQDADISDYKLSVCDGKSIPFADNSYDVVFSVICLQHICCYSVRLSIMKDIYRVLKPSGHLCFQMGFGLRSSAEPSYYENRYDIDGTNGHCDVNVLQEIDIKTDLENIGFKNYKSDIRPTGPGDSHPNWIWVQVEK